LREIVNYSFVSDKLLNLFDAAGAERRVVIPRPVNAEHTILRDSLLPQMVATLGRNRSRQVAEAAFFEIARVFSRPDQSKYHEETRVAIGLMGAVGRALLRKRQPLDEAEVFAWLKGILQHFHEKLFPAGDPAASSRSAGAQGLVINEWTGHDKIPAGFYPACFKPRRLAVLTLGGKFCGLMGILKDEIRREWRILEPVGLLEFTLAPFLARAFQAPVAQVLPVYPSVTRDISLRVPAAVRHAEITKTIWKNAPKELTALALFDIYTGKEIGTGFKSMAYSLTYQSLERTLTDEEVNKLHESVKKQLKSELMVDIREG
jgi:phenylalanyl-tRNA synthetase beta chain